MSGCELLSAYQADRILEKWRDECTAGSSRKKQQEKRFSKHLLKQYGGDKIVKLVLRTGVLDATLLNAYRSDVLTHSELGNKISGGVHVPAVARPNPLKRKKDSSLEKEKRLESREVRNRKLKRLCQRCGEGWGNVGPCEVCHFVCGSCCIWAGRTVCLDCPQVDFLVDTAEEVGYCQKCRSEHSSVCSMIRCKRCRLWLCAFCARDDDASCREYCPAIFAAQGRPLRHQWWSKGGENNHQVCEKSISAVDRILNEWYQARAL